MSAQPSPEAVVLVAAACRAERELVVEEETNGFQTPRHWALTGRLDAATEKLFAYVIALEADKARMDWLFEHLSSYAIEGRVTLVKNAYYDNYRDGVAPGHLVRAAIDAARTPSEVTTC